MPYSTESPSIISTPISISISISNDPTDPTDPTDLTDRQPFSGGEA